MPTNEPFYEHLPCQLEPRELLLKSKALAELLSQHEKVELEKKLANQAFKEQLDDLDSQINATAVEVRTGREYREVPCIESAEWSENRVNIIRTDTGEVVRIRPLQQGERQEALPHVKATAAQVRADNQNDADEFKEKMQ